MPKTSKTHKAWVAPASIMLSLGLIGSLSACTNAETPKPESSNSVSSDANKLPLANNGTPVNNGKGSYLQTTVDNNDPAMKYNAVLSTPAAKAKYSDAQLEEAQKAVVKFIAEQTIDSTVQGGGSGSDWVEKNKALIAPVFLDNVKKLVSDPKSGFLIDNPNRKSAGYSLKYDEKSPRVSSRYIEVTKIDLSKDRPLVTANIEYTLKTDKGKLEKAAGVVSYAVTQIDGKWLISGYESKVAITPFTVNK